MSVSARDDAIYTRADLLMDREGNVPHPQPPDRLIDLDELKIADGWMRATAPSGRVAYQGVAGWTPTAGVGLRPPERGQSGPRGAGAADDPGGEGD
jgi:NADH-quinone oxidoreductase subunit I